MIVLAAAALRLVSNAQAGEWSLTILDPLTGQMVKIRKPAAPGSPGRRRGEAAKLADPH